MTEAPAADAIMGKIWIDLFDVMVLRSTSCYLLFLICNLMFSHDRSSSTTCDKLG